MSPFIRQRMMPMTQPVMRNPMMGGLGGLGSIFYLDALQFLILTLDLEV